MEIVVVIFAMLLLLVLSNLAVRLLPFVSLPLHQIALGVAFGMFPASHALELEAEMFLLIFVAPLLFMDSKTVSNSQLWRHRNSILSMSVALVFATVLLVGPVIHMLVPALPLAGAFAIAAILSPTDPVAVKAIFGKLNVPHRQKIVLEGESLINDAAGLVTFRFALAALITGSFSLVEAGLQFALVAGGGIVVGAAAMSALMALTKFLMRLGVADTNVYALVRLAAPFAVFLAAESLHFSGVLAVVCAGIVSSVGHAHVIRQQEAQIRFVSDGAWSMALFVLNGFVFLYLGTHMPRIIEARLAQSGGLGLVRDIGTVLLVYLAVMLVRFFWVFLFIENGLMKKSLFATLSGVKGAITLAAAFSIPLTFALGDGGEIPFFERDLILFVCGGVIVVSILAASALLPLLSEKSTGRKELMEHGARKRLISTAIKKEQEALMKNSCISLDELAAQVHNAERALIKEMYGKGEIDKATKIRLTLDITLEEVAQLEDKLHELEE